MSQQSIEVHGVSSPKELIAANDLLAKTQLPSYRESIRWLEESGPNWPGFKREHTRVAYIGNELVGGLRILTFALRIGKARLKCGGIGWVSTKPPHRNKGVCRALMRDAHEFMKRAGYHVSLLFGVPNLYQKFGYVTAIPGYSIVVSSDFASLTKSRYRTRRVTWNDATRLRAIHDRGMAGAPFFVERSATYFKTIFHCTARTIPFWPDWKATIAMLDSRNQIAGYFMPQWDKDELHIKEVGANDPQTCDAVIAASAALARKRGVTRIRFHVPQWHPFALHLRDYESLHETQFYQNREGMLALINLTVTLKAIAPEWSSLIDQSSLKDEIRKIGLQLDRESYALKRSSQSFVIEKQKIRSAISLTHQEFCRLLTGFTSGSEFLRTSPRQFTTSQQQMLECIFPHRAPFVWPIDHF